jgi:hypothetical protein
LAHGVPLREIFEDEMTSMPTGLTEHEGFSAHDIDFAPELFRSANVITENAVGDDRFERRRN